MRITLNQNEIQQALRDYVNELISVGEGMVVTVTLDDNASALVEILPEGESSDVATPAVAERAPQKRRSKAEMAAANPVVIAAAEVLVEVAQAVLVVEPVVEVAAVVAKVVVETPVVEAVAEVAPVVADVAPTSDAPRASLFANLRKPVNA